MSLMEPEDGLAATSYRVFVRKARQAAHQSLFFLYHLAEWPGQATRLVVDHYRPFALQQIKALVMGIQAPAPKAAPTADAAGTRREPTKVLGAWQVICEALLSTDELDAGRAKTVLDLFQDFLLASRATGWGLVNHLVASVWRALAKHTAVSIALVLVVVALFAPEQVRSLLFFGNRLGWLLVPFAFVGVVAMFLVGYRIGRFRIGRRAFWMLRYQATEPERGISRWPAQSPLMSHIAQGLLLKVVVVGVVQALAFAVVFGLPEAMSGSRTSGIIVSLAVLVLAVAHTVDRWDFIDERPTRLMTLLGVLACAVLAFLGGRYAVIAFLLALVVLPFGARWVQGGHTGSPRWTAWVFGGVYLAVCARLVLGGVTDRREVIVEEPAGAAPLPRVSDGLWPWPGTGPVAVMAASGGGSRAAIYTARTLAALPEEVRVNLQAISSVSGGSLASAAYIQRLRERGQRFDSSAGAALVEDVSDDFILPTIAGLASLTMSRGKYLEGHWDRFLTTGSGATMVHELGVAWADALAGSPPPLSPPFPLPLFNSCTLDGHAVVISPLAPDLYRRGEAVLAAVRARYPGETLTDVFDRDGIYALEDLVGKRDLSLAQAVRASANFPFGFPLVTMRTRAANLRYLATASEAATREVKLTDGGVLSNSGMWSLFNLLTHEPKVVEKLRTRGVLLIVVEVNRMPSVKENRQDLLSLKGMIGKKDPVAQRLHRAMFETLRTLYGARIAIVQVDLRPTEPFNIGTTWALDEVSKARIAQSFDEIARPEMADIPGHWAALRAAAATPAPEAPSRPPATVFVRPPLD